MQQAARPRMGRARNLRPITCVRRIPFMVHPESTVWKPGSCCLPSLHGPEDMSCVGSLSSNILCLLHLLGVNPQHRLKTATSQDLHRIPSELPSRPLTLSSRNVCFVSSIRRPSCYTAFAQGYFRRLYHLTTLSEEKDEVQLR